MSLTLDTSAAAVWAQSPTDYSIASSQLDVVVLHMHKQAAFAASCDAQLLVQVQPVYVASALQGVTNNMETVAYKRRIS